MSTVSIRFPFDMTFLDYPDNESCAVILYIMGCDNKCVGCHNEKFKDHGYKVDTEEMTPKKAYYYVRYFADKFNTNKIVISGGDPLSHMNAGWTRDLLLTPNRANLEYCVYTGHSIELIKTLGITGFKYVKTGNYIPELKQEQIKNDKYMQLASKNQCFYNDKFELMTKDGLLKFNDDTETQKCIQ